MDDLSSGWLRSALAGYGIEMRSVAKPAGGQDPVARSHVVTDVDDRRWLVKVRPATAPRDTAAEVTTALGDAGLPLVVAPLRTLAGSVTLVAGDVSITVTPFLDARPAWDSGGLSPSQWTQLGRFARHLHETVLPRPLQGRLPAERYRPPELDLVAGADEAAAALRRAPGPEGDVAAWWRDHRGQILDLAARTDALGTELRGRDLPLVVCHADLHTGNVLVDADGGLWVVDWDELVLAPRERDLMFVIGGISEALVRPDDTARFLDGYGDVDIDRRALGYYRHAWAIQDVAGYAHQVLVERDRAADARAEAAGIFLGLFRPGEIVDLAGRTEV